LTVGTPFLGKIPHPRSKSPYVYHLRREVSKKSNIFERFTSFFEYFQTFSNVSHHFSNVFKRFRLAYFTQTPQTDLPTPVFRPKTHILPKKTGQNPQISSEKQNFLGFF